MMERIRRRRRRNLACVKATVTLSKVVLSTSAREVPDVFTGEDCCGGVSPCEGEGVVVVVLSVVSRSRVRASLTATTVMVEVVVLEAESGAVVSDDGQGNAVAGGGGVLVGVFAESIEESFCLCGGSCGCAIACEGDGGGA